MVQQASEADAGTDAELFEEIEATEGWRLMVLDDGTVEARGPHERDIWTTRPEGEAPPDLDYAFGVGIERVLAWYLAKTGRRRHAGRYVGDLRTSVREALCDEGVAARCGEGDCGGDGTHVKVISAPSSHPRTRPVCDDHATEGDYTTLYPME